MRVLVLCGRATVVAVAAFLDAFQKVADMASGSRGRTPIGGGGVSGAMQQHHGRTLTP